MKKRFGALLAYVVLVVCVVGLSNLLDAGENAADNSVDDSGDNVVVAEEIIDLADEEEPLAAFEPVDDFAEQLLELVNAARAEAGVAALQLDDTLCGAAGVRAAECLTSFSHTRPDGTRYVTAITQAGLAPGYSGENLATGQETPEAVMKSWLGSEGHRANILNPNYQKLGVAWAKNTGGRYKGYAWVQLFTD